MKRRRPAHPTEDAVGGIAALLAAVVRAHLPALAIGLTGSFTLLLPMLSACFAAMLLPTLLHDPPIYDPLRDLTAPEHGNIRLFRRGSIDPQDCPRGVC